MNKLFKGKIALVTGVQGVLVKQYRETCHAGFRCNNTLFPKSGLVEPKDIADIVSFLCSNESAMITGQIIVLDGGRSLIPFGNSLYNGNKDET